MLCVLFLFVSSPTLNFSSALRWLFYPLCGVSSRLHGTQQDHLRSSPPPHYLNLHLLAWAGIKPSTGRVVYCNGTGNRFIGLGFYRLDEDHRMCVFLLSRSVSSESPR